MVKRPTKKSDVEPVAPAPQRKRRPKRKPKVAVAGWTIDWYAVGLAILAAITIAPYVLPFLKDIEKPAVSVDFSESLGNVSSWFGNVASDDPRSDVPKYVEALRAVAESEIANVSEIQDKLKAEVEARLDKTGWLNWGLFNIDLFKEMRRLRESKKLDSVASHQKYLAAVADALEKL